eukprot:CAMPEP_0198688092 /NCGR_PEP_ID=MMETSP1468-20131203/91440_1 /TAXON_ID=1461545 /ORGANISM="Mantoniella sp, Strain CCMP1436" /LENGTH=66 /DNA_ID=CAMNT_0044437185 /DNA_START=211 /DNA_END=408 /DNA_ORIENTATION=-
MASRASLQVLRQMRALTCRPPAVRAAGPCVGHATAGARTGGSTVAHQSMNRLLTTNTAGAAMGAGE